ncbi:MAG TPA: MFS transporter [Anaerolineae bacterium]|nr:MFS transporter [Anaerolineae bacterium]
MQRGLRSFIIIWIGQFASLFGSALTRFAITVWIYQKTGSATALTTGGFFAMAPTFLLLPIGGALADRLDRKKVMIAADLTGGLCTVFMLSLYLNGNLQIWHIYLTNVILSAVEAFQYPAFTAATAMIVPKEHFARVSGMRDLAGNASRIFAPLLAGALLAILDLSQFMIIDLITLSIALLTLTMVAIPKPTQTEESKRAQANLLQDVTYGFKFIWKRPSLVILQSILLTLNFLYTMGNMLIPAMILSRTNNNELILGSVQAVMSAGALAGGLLISIWGGSKRKIKTVLMAQVLTAIVGRVWFGLGYDTLSWLLPSFFVFFFIPISNGSTAAIWLAKTPPDVQGRVFATRRFAAQFCLPLSALLAGPLAERVFEPAMMPGGALASLFGNVLHTGVGAGISLMMLLSGIIGAAVSLLVYVIPLVWRVDEILPDHIAEPSSLIPEKTVDSDVGVKAPEGAASPAD